MKLPKRNKIDTKKNIKLTREYKHISDQFKPNGLWYGCNDDWYNWVKKAGMKKFLHKYIHKINIKNNVMTDIRNKDKNKLLIIKNIKDFDIFNKRYGVGSLKRLANGMYISYKINWKKVAKEYGGMEICPAVLKERGDYIWYAAWDTASGCIWDTKSIIRNIELIYEKKKGKYIKV